MYKRSKKKEKGPKLKVIMSPYIGSKEDPVIKVKISNVLALVFFWQKRNSLLLYTCSRVATY